MLENSLVIRLDYVGLYTLLQEQTIDKLVLTFLMEFCRKHGTSTTHFSDSVVWGLQESLSDLTYLLTITPNFNEQLQPELTAWLTNLGFRVLRT